MYVHAIHYVRVRTYHFRDSVSWKPLRRSPNLNTIRYIFHAVLYGVYILHELMYRFEYMHAYQCPKMKCYLHDVFMPMKC